MGAGHDGVAYELERRLHAKGASARVVDYLELLPARLGPFYRAVYQGQLKYAPSSYEWLYGKMDRGVLAPVAARVGQLGQRRVRRLARGHDVVISTYPLGCQATGALRRKGKLGIPAVGFLTDVDVHALWLHPGIDLNLTVWHGSAVEAIDRVGSPSRAVGPVLPEAFLAPTTATERASGRALMGLDEATKVVLVVAGSWGVGDISATARAIRDSGAGTPVVLCGRNTDLLAELTRENGIVPVGWTSQVRELMAASDVLVHNAGGLSCLEGFAMGIPVIGHACLPGHGHRNAEAMRDADVAAYAESTDDLIVTIRRLARTPEGVAMAARARALFHRDPTDELLALAAAPVPEVTLSATRTWTRRAATVGVSVPVLLLGASQVAVHAQIGVAKGKGAVYVAALLDHSQLSDPRVLTSLRRLPVSVAVTAETSGPTPTDIGVLRGQGISVVGADTLGRTRNPDRREEALNAAARAVSATHEEDAKVVCLRAPGMVERVVAWDHEIRLAQSNEVLRPGQQPTRLAPGAEVVLDERGRSASQVAADLEALAGAVRSANLPQKPMRALWLTT